MSTTYTANIVIGLRGDDLESWALENEEILYDLFDYYERGDVFGFLYEGTEYCKELTYGDNGRFDSLIDKFESITGLTPKVFLLVDRY